MFLKINIVYEFVTSFIVHSPGADPRPLLYSKHSFSGSYLSGILLGRPESDLMLTAWSRLSMEHQRLPANCYLFKCLVKDNEEWRKYPVMLIQQFI